MAGDGPIVAPSAGAASPSGTHDGKGTAMIDWSLVTRDDLRAIVRIVGRAQEAGIVNDRQVAIMNLQACHTHGCPLNLADLETASVADLAHDLNGIGANLDHYTGRLRNAFVPRHALRPAAKEKECSTSS